MRNPRALLLLLAASSLVAACVAQPGASPDVTIPAPVGGGSPTTSPTDTPEPGPSPSPYLEWTTPLPQSGWSEGLEWHDGQLFHAYPGSIDVVSTADGAVLAEMTPPTAYSESVTWWNGHLYDLSYDNNGIYEGTYDPAKMAATWTQVGNVPDPKAGWGIATDGRYLYMSGDGHSQIFVVDPKTMQLVRTIDTPITYIEDIAYQDGWLWASESYHVYPAKIFRIDLDTGDILDFFDVPGADQCDVGDPSAASFQGVLDGIAVAHDRLWVTGKNCPSIFVADVKHR